MSGISEQMRLAWARYECKPELMQVVSFCGDKIRVAPGTEDAWKALETVLKRYHYDVRLEDTDSYACRSIKSGDTKSLHSYGIALDINWKTNPYRDHPGKRKPRFSVADSQAARAQDVKLGAADTDMTRAMVDAALAISTVKGHQVFGWGGDWETLKDAMHFQIQVTPDELAEGIDWDKLAAGGSDAAQPLRMTTMPSSKGDEMGLPKAFFDSVRATLFAGKLSQSAVDNMTAIVGYWQTHYPAGPRNQLAYILATVLAEVGAEMAPVREGFCASDAEARAKLSHREYAKSAGPYGHAYYGRGYVQLTHLENYEEQGARLGIDLVRYPDLALRTPVALSILVDGMMSGAFNGERHGLGHYVDHVKRDFEGARRTVNGQNRAAEIASYAESFAKALAFLPAVEPEILMVAEAEPGIGKEPERAAESATVGSAVLADIARQLETILGRLEALEHARSELPLPTKTDPRPSLNVDMKALAQRFGVPPEALQGAGALLSALQSAGVLKPVPGLTPVNAALGETIGRALNGKKTALGVVTILISIFLPQLAPLTTFIGNGGTGAVNVETLQNILMPLGGLLAGWGGLGKVDKWMHKTDATELLSALRAIQGQTNSK